MKPSCVVAPDPGSLHKKNIFTCSQTAGPAQSYRNFCQKNRGTVRKLISQLIIKLFTLAFGPSHLEFCLDCTTKFAKTELYAKEQLRFTLCLTRNH